MIPIPIKLLHSDAQSPKYQTDGASGMDLHCIHPVSAWGNVYTPDLSDTPVTLVPFWRMSACIEQITKVVLNPGDRALFSTGISLAIPPGYEGQIRPRSGWALKDGITVLNSPGTIDSDYKGEIKVLLINLGHESVEIKRGDRIAQLVIAPVLKAELIAVDEIETSARGAGSFGSSGRG